MADDSGHSPPLGRGDDIDDLFVDDYQEDFSQIREKRDDGDRVKPEPETPSWVPKPPQTRSPDEGGAQPLFVRPAPGDSRKPAAPEKGTSQTWRDGSSSYRPQPTSQPTREDASKRSDSRPPLGQQSGAQNQPWQDRGAQQQGQRDDRQQQGQSQPNQPWQDRGAQQQGQRDNRQQGQQQGQRDSRSPASQQGFPAPQQKAAPPAAKPATSGGQVRSTPTKSSPAPAIRQRTSGLSTLPEVQGIKLKPRVPAKADAKEDDSSRKASQPAGKTKLPPWLVKLRKQMPPYIDEVVAFVLIAVGLLTLLMLLSPASGALGASWSTLLRKAFGLGAFVIALLIMAGGAALLMPKMGFPVRLNWWRIMAGENFFFMALAALHATIRARIGGEAGEVEAYARAIEGHGGGLVGWAIQDLIHLLMGDIITGAILITGLVISGTILLGLKRSAILSAVDSAQVFFANAAKKLEEPPRKPTDIHIPGRPSIVTGRAGDGLHLTMKEDDDADHTTLKQRLMATDEVPMRFELEETTEKRRPKKRSEALPSLDLLVDRPYDRPSEKEINVNAHLIEKTVADFGLDVHVVDVKAGPTVTQYAVQPFTRVDEEGKKVIKRVRITRVTTLAKDISLALSAKSVRIQAPVPGTNYIGIEVPNPSPGVVTLRPLLESTEYNRIKSPLGLALGREVDGTPFAADLSRMPHLLIGGTTGSGKSVALRSMASCLIASNRPEQLRLVLIDPKMVELIRFNGLPHLLGRVEVEVERIMGVLRWTVQEMDRRYRTLEADQARNIATYNQGKRGASRLPYIVVIVDELAELMMAKPEDTEFLITRLAQMARAVGIHLIVATQRPSTDVVTGLIKANFPARISFAVASGTDSRVILDTTGAQDLIGNGDMLFQNSDAAGPIRLQGAFVSDIEMERLVEYWVENWEPEDDEEAPWDNLLAQEEVVKSTDDLIVPALEIIQKEGEASASALQRKLGVGYPRAARIVDALFKLGAIGPETSGGRLREVLIPADADPMAFIVAQEEKRRRGEL